MRNQLDISLLCLLIYNHRNFLLAVSVRSELTFPFAVLSHYLYNHTMIQLRAAQRILCYLTATIKHEMFSHFTFNLKRFAAFVVYWDGDTETSTSTTSILGVSASLVY